MRAKMQAGAMSKDEAEDAALVEALFHAMPSFGFVAVRAARAVALFFVASLLARNITGIEPVLTVAFCISVLSLFNMAKWVAVAAVAMLLAANLVPPAVLGFLAACAR